jgi:hypothetical protein
MGSAQSQPNFVSDLPFVPHKPNSIAPTPINIPAPQPPIVIHGITPDQHKVQKHHEHHTKHHNHHQHHEHFLGLSNVSCQSVCNSVVSVGEEIFTLKNSVLILVILLLAYYIYNQK